MRDTANYTEAIGMIRTPQDGTRLGMPVGNLSARMIMCMFVAALFDRALVDVMTDAGLI